MYVPLPPTESVPKASWSESKTRKQWLAAIPLTTIETVIACRYKQDSRQGGREKHSGIQLQGDDQ
ncbi:hypothetical protein DZF95_02270 [Clavibacter michiganensis]|nr:hypothetical protein DZF95_02270 [Clavibacter michiganensis]